MPKIHALRGSILHSIADPREVGVEKSYEYWEDGVLLIDNGIISQVGDAKEILHQLSPDIPVREYRDALITPGFIDTHIHMPQVGVMGAYGAQLLEWLETYTFPNEGKFKDREHSRQASAFFLQELLRHGTTTALVFGTVHKNSVEELFKHALRLNLRIVAGKVLMDRNCPDFLQDTAESGYKDSKELIQEWHGKGRLSYAVTPRFAPTSSSEQLAAAGKLLKEHPGVYMHTHISENTNEIKWVRELFPDTKNYLDVYNQHGLVGPRSVFAHGVHLCEDECRVMGESGAAVSFCPTSNMFLGSGLFPLKRFEDNGVRVGMGTDVGGGTSFSMLQTVNEAYKAVQLQGQSLDPFKSLYLATLGGARALYLDKHIGSFAPGKDADFIVMDYHSTPLTSFRLSQATTLREKLFVLLMLGDDRAIKATYVAGQLVHCRDCDSPSHISDMLLGKHAAKNDSETPSEGHTSG